MPEGEQQHLAQDFDHKGGNSTGGETSELRLQTVWCRRVDAATAVAEAAFSRRTDGREDSLDEDGVLLLSLAVSRDSGADDGDAFRARESKADGATRAAGGAASPWAPEGSVVAGSIMLVEVAPGQTPGHDGGASAMFAR